MPRRDVKLCAGEFYHLYNRGNNRAHIFYERENYGFFIRRLREYVLPVVDIVAYCLMPTHYHLLVYVKKTSGVSEASRAMMRLSVSYTKAMNKRYDRVGSLFQGSFRAKHVDSNNYLVHLSRYIHLNPLLAGLVKQPQNWEISSYREYVGSRNGTLVEPGIVLAQFPSPGAYREFVESYISDERGIIADLLFE